MLERSNGVMQSNKLRGALWIVAALPMILAPVIFDGNKPAAAIGILFLILGIATLRKDQL